MNRKNNKGAAMVSVLVAVTFIAILSSALLYMAYMNYLTKTMRVNAADTFYTAEYALDDLSTSLQQIMAQETKIDVAVAKLETACGVTGATGYERYNGTEVAKNIKYAINDPHIKEIIVDTTYASPSQNYIKKAGSATFKGLKITATTDRDFTSTIVTDLTIYFPNSGPGDIDVNSFSILSDNSYELGAGLSTLTGNIFVKAPGCNQANPSGDDALVVSSEATCTLLSPRGLIFGDVRIEGTGALTIAGNVAVTGDIYIDDDAILFVSGKLIVNGSIDHDDNDHIKGRANVVRKSGTMTMSSLPDTGITSDLYSNVMIWNGSSWESVDAKDLLFSLPASDGSSGTRNNDVDSEYTGLYYGGTYAHGTGEIKSACSELIFLLDNSQLKDVENVFDSTLLTTEPLTTGIDDKTVHFSRMPNEGYNAAKYTLIGKGGYASGDITEFEAAKAESSAKVMTYWDDKAKAAGNMNNDTIRYAIYYDDKNYVPWGYLFRGDSAARLSEIMNSVLGDVDPKNTSAGYDNWYKD